MRRVAAGTVALTVSAAMSLGCASTAAPTALRSDSAPEQPAGPTDSTDSTDATDPIDTAPTGTVLTDTDVTTTGIVVTTDSGADVTIESVPDHDPPPTFRPDSTPPPATVPPATVPPATTVDPAAYETALVEWSAACSTALAGVAALPGDVLASLGELARVISELDAAATAVTPTGRPDDPLAFVRERMAAAASSLTSAAVAFAGGDMVEVQRLRDEAVAHVEEIAATLRAFGATC